MKIEAHKLAKKSFFLLSYNAIGAVVGYVTMFFALKFVGEEAWGIFGSALAISGFLGILADLGLNTTHIKKSSQKKNVEECLGAYIALKGILLVIFMLTSFFGFFFLGNVLGFKFESPYLRTAAYIAVLGMLNSAMADVFKTMYQSKLKAGKSIGPLFVQLAVQDLSLVAFSIRYAVGSSWSPDFVGVLFVYSYLLGTSAKVITYAILAIRDRVVIRKPTYTLIREYVLFALPLAFYGIISSIQSYTDRIMLQFFWNSAIVGGYFAVQKLTLSVGYIGSSLIFFLYPAQASYFEGKSHRDFRDITVNAERYLSLFVLPISIFFVVMSAEILNIFRHSLVNYSTTMMILAIYGYMVVINMPYNSQLTSASLQVHVMIAGLFQVFLNVFLNAIFIPKSVLGIPLFGLKSTGAALATLLSFLVGFLYIRYRVYKNLNVHFNKRIIMHLVSAASSSVVLYLLKMKIQLFSWYAIAGSFILFILIYAGLLYLMRELKKDDLKIIIKIFKS